MLELFFSYNDPAYHVQKHTQPSRNMGAKKLLSDNLLFNNCYWLEEIFKHVGAMSQTN